MVVRDLELEAYFSLGSLAAQVWGGVDIVFWFADRSSLGVDSCQDKFRC